MILATIKSNTGYLSWITYYRSDRYTKEWGRSRGPLGWREYKVTGFFISEHVKNMQEMYIDLGGTNKPVLNEYQLREIDERIHT